MLSEEACNTMQETPEKVVWKTEFQAGSENRFPKKKIDIVFS